MNAQLKEWKLAVERLWSASPPDHRASAQLAADIARQGDEPRLQQAAAQALPSLRAACLKGAPRSTRELAHRRLGAIRDVLHALTAPHFGKRSAEALTPEEHARRMLGLPLGRRLYGPEIHQAYKRAAKTAHPDGGGSEGEFQDLSAAHDALMKAL